MTQKDLQIAKKTTKIYELIFKNKTTGAYEDITDWTIYFTAKINMNDPDASAVISKTVTEHSEPTNGITLITLEPTDTDIDAGNYYFDIGFKDDDAQQGVLIQGKLRIVETVRKTRG